MWKDIVIGLQVCILVEVVKGLDYRNELEKYEIVEPLHISKQSRLIKRDLSTKQIDVKNVHLEDTRFEISGYGQHFIINLEKNRNLIPPSFVSIYQDKNGKLITEKTPPENCYYHGQLEGRKDSFVAFSTCHGLRGLIHDTDGEEYFIEPLQDHTNSSHIMFNMKDLITKKSHCGHNHTYDEHENFLGYGSMTEHFKRKRRNVDKERKYIETVAVVDNRKFRAWGRNVKTSNEKAIEIMNFVDVVYKTLNTRIPLIAVIVWNTVDGAQVTSNAGVTLSNFGVYTRTVVNKASGLNLKADNAQLITDIRFDKASLVGLAGVGTICTSSSSAINRDHSSNPAVSANTIAHELGHNLGFLHNTGGCKCPNPPCIMNAVVSGSQAKGFTDCTTKTFNSKADGGNYPCLLDYPDKLFTPVKCGNGYRESGEDCDCGTEAECKASGADKCCDYSTCKLQATAQCADGLCCSNCKFKGQGALCREKFHSECDLEEYCSGSSSECPRNSYRRDGDNCADGEGYCYEGFCKTHTVQCETLWGSGGMKAIDKCFGANKAGDEYGHCGKDLRDNYIKCTEQNMLCGKIQCKAKPGDTLTNLPKIGTKRGRTTKRIIAGKDSFSCTVAKMHFDEEQVDPTLVQDGTKCGQDKICIAQKCVAMSSYVSAGNCSGMCKNGGVCNNNGNCHCPKGYACPYCEFAGVGGSSDSGQGCIIQDDCSCLTPLVKGMLVLFLLVIPLILLIAFCSYRHKASLRARWRAYQETKRGGTQDTKASRSFIGNHSGGQTRVQMKTGAATNQKPLQNPYSTENQAPTRSAPMPPSSYSQSNSGKSFPPPKLPPIGGTSPHSGGTMHQTDVPKVQVRKPYR